MARTKICVFLSLVVVGLGACSGNSPEKRVAEMNDSNIKRVANLYGAFLAMHNWQGPKTEGEFKTFIGSAMPPKKLAMMGVDPKNVDSLFISERDGKPLKIRYGVTASRSEFVPVAFEQQGIDGKRMVAFTNATTEETDEARYKQLLEGRGKG